jgi:NAD(P)-dependent dehydrogenase (short-subunit alcohol dehydrogenase family)
MTRQAKRILLVTGGSRGIGAAVVRQAARAGFDIAINYVSDAGAAEMIASDVRALGQRAITIKADVGKPNDIEAMFATIDTHLGRLTDLVNNAGITGKSSRLDGASTETIRNCIDINVIGAILVAKAAIMRLSNRHGGQGGCIVNMSSAATNLGSPGEGTWYAASKGAIDSLTIGLSRELAAEAIRVNAVTPGLIDTDIHEKGMGDASRLIRLTPNIPLGRPGTADEIADAVMFLLSDASRYMMGANLRVSGGR